MVAYNFMAQFANDVATGKKRQTFRRNKRAKRGDKLQLYTGLRTKACRKLADGICTSVQPAHIHAGYVVVQGNKLTIAQQRAFVKADGFKDFESMVEFFRKKYKKLPVHGYVTKWRLEDVQA